MKCLNIRRLLWDTQSSTVYINKTGKRYGEYKKNI